MPITGFFKLAKNWRTVIDQSSSQNSALRDSTASTSNSFTHDPAFHCPQGRLETPEGGRHHTRAYQSVPRLTVGDAGIDDRRSVAIDHLAHVNTGGCAPKIQCG